MNSLKDCDQGFKIHKCAFLKNIRILDTDQGKFVVKKKKQNHYDLFRYLETQGFNHFIATRDEGDYEVYPYIEELNVTEEEKALDIIYLISMLHNKTTFYKNVDLDLIKKIYEDINEKLTYIEHYYDDLKIVIEDAFIMSPSGYLLLRNSTVIFTAIENSRYFIKKWYQSIKDKKNFRVATIHNYLELDHLIKGDNLYLISWDRSCTASPIYDLYHLYRNIYNKVDFSTLFEVYHSKYPLLEEEYYLLFSLLLVPDKIELSKREVFNTKEVYEFTNYLIATIQFVSKHHSKGPNSETNQF